MDDNLKKEFFDHIDGSIEKSLRDIAGAEVAEQVAKAVANARLDKALGLTTGVTDEEKKAFITDIRAISRGEKAAYLGNSDQTGGYLIPTEIHNEVLRIAATTGLVVRDARRFSMSTDELDIPRYTGSVMQGEYVGEDTEGSETQNDYGTARLFAKTWMTIFRVGNNLLADASVNIADWLMAMAAEGMAYRLDREGFMGGTFAGSPFVGLLGSSDVTLQTMATGATGFGSLSLPEASDAIGALPTAALGNAAFYMHRSVWAKLRARSTNGVFEYGQSNIASLRRESGLQPVGEILGYPVYTTDVLPSFASSAVSTKFAVFGNLSLALAWGDRGPMEIAKSDSATVGGKSVFRANQTAMRFTHRHAESIALPAAAVVIRTAAS